MNGRFEKVLQQKMDRKQFFKHIGAGLAAVVGLGLITKALMPQEQPRNEQQQKTSYGYGSSVYGGVKKS